MNKVAHWIVRNRIVVLIIALLLLIPSVIGYMITYVNYDILSYLPQDVDSMKGQSYLENDFQIASTSMLVVEKMQPYQVQKLKEKISQIEGVKKVLWVDDVLDISVPKEMMPDDFQKIFYSKDSTLLLINFDDTTAAKSTFDAIKQIKKVTSKDCYLGGMSAILEDTKALADKETPIYIVVAIILALVVLFLGMESTLVPFIFMVGIFFAIAYNFGTNFFLGEISYVTKSLAAVLQLGVTMDFSIFLLHRYEEEKSKFADREDAMASAIQATFVSIFGSSLTAAFGFLALCTMSLALGKDIGIVMAKGVVLGVISTLTILPSMLLVFDKAIHKHTHKTIIQPLEKTSQFVVKHYKALLVIFLILIIPFGIAQSKTKVYYALDETLPKDLPSIVGTNKLKDDYQMTTTHFVLVDEKLDNQQMNQITKEVEKIPGVNTVLSYEKYIGGRIPEEAMPSVVKDTLVNGGKKMMVVNSIYKAASDEENQQIDAIDKVIKSYDKQAVIAGEGALTKDLIEVSDQDFKNVNVVSIIAIFFIIALCFKSLSIPILLVAAIEFAVTINMGLPYFTGTTLPFIAEIVIGTIQLGSTVNYAILMTSRFKEELKNGYATKQAVQISVARCSAAIITSGLCFFAANIGVYFISKMDLIKSLCMLMARGAIISTIVIILVLPAILIVSQKLIEKTTLHWPKAVKAIK